MILALMYVPCEDAVVKYDGTSIANVIDKDFSQKHANSDICTPFCTCACCTTPTVALVQFHVIHHPVSIKVLLGEHIVGKFIDVSLPVWQPPQIA